MEPVIIPIEERADTIRGLASLIQDELHSSIREWDDDLALLVELILDH